MSIYDTVRGVENAVQVGLQLRQHGQRLQGIRLDSGDLLNLSLNARRILDQNGLKDVRIFASGNLDEHRIRELVKAGAPIDEFGVGTAMVVSADAPALDVAYKLTEYKGTPRMKTSQHKLSIPGRKQVFRALQEDGDFCCDLIGLADENEAAVARELTPAPAGITAILERQFGNRHRVGVHPALAEMREQFLRSLTKLAPGYQDLESPDTYPVRYTARLQALIAQGKVDAQKRQN